MHILSLSAKAQTFYESGRSRTMISGYERNVLVRDDFDNCLFVDSDYRPQPGDNIFRCQTINQQTVISLKISIPKQPDLAEIALKGKFTHDQWLAMLKATNGLLFSTVIDPRDEITGEVDTPDLQHAIQSLTKAEGQILAQQIQLFWATTPPTNEFITKFL